LLNQPILTENELFLQLSEGDPEAFKDLVKAYFPILCSYAENFLPDSSLAKDVVQETFIKFWQYKGSMESITHLKGFLFTLTKNGCLNMQRGREREKERNQKVSQLDSLEEQNAYDDIVKLEYYGQVNQIVQRMPEKMREVFLLSFEEALSIEEIAKKLHISIKTVRNQKYKALLLLRKQFGNSGVPLLLILYKLLK
jgi:RNA polymerase sigma-70 factor (ECF subfamily)